jgi:hypothetical protein
MAISTISQPNRQIKIARPKLILKPRLMATIIASKLQVDSPILIGRSNYAIEVSFF